ncbi:MAG: hypothetical protein ACYC4K_03835 [Thiobacillus sp.]
MLSGLALKAQGMDDAMAAAGELWADHAYRVFKDWSAARKSANKRQFRFEEYRDYCQSIDLLPESHKAWGALARSLARSGLMRKTGFVEPAVSVKTHGHDVAVWRLV